MGDGFNLCGYMFLMYVDFYSNRIQGLVPSNDASIHSRSAQLNLVTGFSITEQIYKGLAVSLHCQLRSVK